MRAVMVTAIMIAACTPPPPKSAPPRTTAEKPREIVAPTVSAAPATTCLPPKTSRVSRVVPTSGGIVVCAIETIEDHRRTTAVEHCARFDAEATAFTKVDVPAPPFSGYRADADREHSRSDGLPCFVGDDVDIDSTAIGQSRSTHTVTSPDGNYELSMEVSPFNLTEHEYWARVFTLVPRSSKRNVFQRALEGPVSLETQARVCFLGGSMLFMGWKSTSIVNVKSGVVAARFDHAWFDRLGATPLEATGASWLVFGSKPLADEVVLAPLRNGGRFNPHRLPARQGFVRRVDVAHGMLGREQPLPEGFPTDESLLAAGPKGTAFIVSETERQGRALAEMVQIDLGNGRELGRWRPPGEALDLCPASP